MCFNINFSRDPTSTSTRDYNKHSFIYFTQSFSKQGKKGKYLLFLVHSSLFITKHFHKFNFIFCFLSKQSLDHAALTSYAMTCF